MPFTDHFGPDVAPTYDRDSAERFTAAHLDAETALLADLAGPGGRAVEFAVGTGRVALPLRARGVDVHGVDLSAAMLAELAAKPGGADVPVRCGSFTDTVVATDVDLVSYDEYDAATQQMWSHHVTLGPGRAERRSIPFRYTWPAELDLMARLAGMRLRERWAWWDRTPFTADSPAHVSVWTTGPDPA